MPVLFLFAIIILAGCTNKKDDPFQTKSTQAAANPTKTSIQTPEPTPSPTPSLSPTQTESSSSADSNPIVYTNNQYGFRFSLPESWKGYSIATSEWKGYEANDQTETGPVISIRDPLWTAKTPRQDIPIMVIPLTTWKSFLEGKISIGTPPVRPSDMEVGQNDKFVFAISEQYLSYLLPGNEEVENLLGSYPLSAFNIELEPSTSPSVTPPPTQTESPSSADSTSIVYTNEQYGFRFSLPESWKGYSIVINEWQGDYVPVATNDKTETGPVISIRDPRWSAKTPRQDIPIMVIPIETWKSILEGKFHIGATPVRPSQLELDQNDKFVFAISSRYNTSFPPGYEEVERILQSNPLEAFN